MIARTIKLGSRVLDAARPDQVGELVAFSGRCGVIRYAWGRKRVPLTRIMRTIGGPGRKCPQRVTRASQDLTSTGWEEVKRITGHDAAEFRKLAKANGLSIHEAYRALKE